uniref:U1-poneritoxin-Ni1a n=1 Tax=Neoponera inversa TaxID=264722 RepID=WTX1A_NEOIV|nr:RecName: Full=U1-poneritoxin-Ni1a; Short=U1-PONTX-Ni1a; AltName: Full=Poneratoxin; AltName: Full=Ponericin Pi II1 [Neoponera inversa]
FIGAALGALTAIPSIIKLFK